MLLVLIQSCLRVVSHVDIQIVKRVLIFARLDGVVSQARFDHAAALLVLLSLLAEVTQGHIVGSGGHAHWLWLNCSGVR